MHKAYMGETGAQIHYREMGEGDPLILLPPSPHSGLYYETVMPYLAGRFRVIAPDYPGFGGSDNLIGEASIEGYAQSLLPLLGMNDSAHLAGFHTGNLVAAELARRQPEKINQLVMIDVPYFDAETRASLNKRMGKHADLPLSINDLQEGFDKNVTARINELDHERAYHIWAESLRAGTFANSAFHAAFTYNCEDRLKALKRHVTVIATTSGLLEPTRAAAQILPQARFTERLDIQGAVFDKHAEDIAAAICQAFAYD